MHVNLHVGRLQLQVDPEGTFEQLAELIRRARPMFEAAGDDIALASLWTAIAMLEHNACRPFHMGGSVEPEVRPFRTMPPGWRAATIVP